MSRRRREMGVRIAIGATPWRVFRGIMAEGSVIAGAGLGMGALLSLVLMRTIRSVLFGVSANDVSTFTSMAVLVAAAVLLTFALPVWRAARVEPGDAIRTE